MTASRSKAEGRAGDGDFQAGGGFGVADEAVGGAEGEGVHGAGRRDADVPVAEAAGVVLDGGLGAGIEDVDGAAGGR